MKKLYPLAVILSFLLSSNTSTAQEENSFMSIDYPTGTVNAISSCGKWVVGGRAGTAFMYNTEAGILTELENETGLYTNANAVSDEGLIIGSSGITSMALEPVYYKNGEWHELENPSTDKMGNAFALSSDEKIIGGLITENGLNKPCLWKLEGIDYKIHLLPCPDIDIFGMEPQGALVTNMSSDGNVLVGRFIDWSGMHNQLIVWKLNEQGEYNYQVLGTDLMYDLEAENPGPTIEWSDYVTADYGTPEYEEQYAAWETADNKREELMKKFYKQVIFSMGVTPICNNGHYFATNATMPDLQDPSITSVYPILYDLENFTYLIYDNHSDNIVCSVTNDGTLLAASPYKDMVRNSYIINENQSEALSLNEWLKNKHDFDIDAELPVTSEGKVTTGTAFLSKNEQNIYSFTIDITNFSYVNYCIRLSDKLEPTSIITIEEGGKGKTVYMDGHTLRINGDATGQADISDCTGKVIYNKMFENNAIDLSHLPQGVYIAKLRLGEKTITTKIAL